MDYRIFPPEEMLEATVELPLSKSVSARQLVIDAIAGCATEVAVADCDDTRVLSESLTRRTGDVNVGAAGTAMRFLTAFYAATEGTDVTLDGSERMRRRPVGALVEALRKLGADIEYAGEEGFPPLRIRGRRLTGGSLEMDASVSSQFTSALLMVAPTMKEALHITMVNEVTSLPYLKMTAEMMRRRGAEVEIEGVRAHAFPGEYNRKQEAVERDWSAASYWYETAALTAGWVTLPGLAPHSLQGDGAMRGYGERLGVVTEFDDGAAELSASPEQFSRFDQDMCDTPDLVQTVAITAAMLGIPFRLTGVHTLRNKETDRLEALRTEALKLGFVFEIEGDNVISWEGRRNPIFAVPEFDTYDDHRMAMALAPVSVFLPGIVVRDAEVVSKSYPDFWEDLRSAGFIITDASEPLPEPSDE